RVCAASRLYAILRPALPDAAPERRLMNRPRRPPFTPARKKKPNPARGPATTGPPRRRSPLDHIPANIEPRFKVLGTGADRHALLTYASPMEMLVVHGFTREI